MTFNLYINPSMDVDNLKKLMSELAETYPRVKTIILFGSFARGTASRRSDIDLIIIMDTNKRFFERYKGIHGDILKLLRPFTVEFFIYTPGEFEKMKGSGNHFINRVLQEGKVLYER